MIVAEPASPVPTEDNACQETKMISERYIFLPCPEGCSKSGVFTVLHNKVPASWNTRVGVAQVTGTFCRGKRWAGIGVAQWPEIVKKVLRQSPFFNARAYAEARACSTSLRLLKNPNQTTSFNTVFLHRGLEPIPATFFPLLTLFCKPFLVFFLLGSRKLALRFVLVKVFFFVSRQ